MRKKMWRAGMVVAVVVMLGANGGRAAEDHPDYGWKSELNGGLGLTSGNSETMTLSVGASTQRRSSNSEFRANVDYKFGESTVQDEDGKDVDNTTTDNVQAGSQYNYLLSLRSYALVQISAVHDAIAKIEYRVIGGPGLGHYLIKRANRKLSVESGFAMLGEEVDDTSDNAVLLRVAQRFEQTFEVGSKIWQSMEYLPQVDDLDLYLWTTEIGTEAIVNSSISMRVVLQNRYDSEPAENREPNDLTVTAGLVYKL